MIFFEIHTGCYKIIHCFENSCIFDRTSFFQRFSILTVIKKWGDNYQIYISPFLKSGITFAIFNLFGNIPVVKD